jgi:hypothetical protein
MRALKDLITQLQLDGCPCCGAQNPTEPCSYFEALVCRACHDRLMTCCHRCGDQLGNPWFENSDGRWCDECWAVLGEEARQKMARLDAELAGDRRGLH